VICHVPCLAAYCLPAREGEAFFLYSCGHHVKTLNTTRTATLQRRWTNGTLPRGQTYQQPLVGGSFCPVFRRRLLQNAAEPPLHYHRPHCWLATAVRSGCTAAVCLPCCGGFAPAARVPSPARCLRARAFCALPAHFLP
jgi:hypothetical protein